jgi:hypothetical protein
MRFIRNIIFWPKRKDILQKPDLILHIGTEKTGTTTIQEFLHLNRNLLARQGVYFPKSIGMRNHRPLASWCLSHEKDDVFLRMNNLTESSHRKAWREDFIAKFEKEISSLKPEIKQVIISSEHFSSLLNHPTEIETLKLLLDKWFTSITVVVFLRRQDSFVVSRYSTVCKAGIVMKSILPNPTTLRPLVNYQILLGKWGSVFGKESITPRIFNPAEFINHDLLQDFIRVCKLPENADYQIPENKNVSFSETAQEVIQCFNKKINQGNENRELRKIRHSIFENVNRKYPGPGKKPLRHEALEFYKFFEASNNQVAREWFGREKLFDEDFSMYPETIPADKPVPDYEKILNEEIQPFSDVLKIFRNNKEN